MGMMESAEYFTNVIQELYLLPAGILTFVLFEPIKSLQSLLPPE